jgi:hypothetical protein
MAPDSPTRIVNIGLRTKRRNCRKTSCRPDFQIRTLNSGSPYKFTLIAAVATTHGYGLDLTCRRGFDSLIGLAALMADSDPKNSISLTML